MTEVGGYDCLFTEKPPDSLVCPVCLLPCREPDLISCCGKKACHSCISRVQQDDQPCPLCRTPQFITLLDREVERQILSLKVYCNNKEDGCTWIGELRQLEGHLNTCFYGNISCKYECGLHCSRQQMFLHERDECELRPEIVLTERIEGLNWTVNNLKRKSNDQERQLNQQRQRIRTQQTRIDENEGTIEQVLKVNVTINENLKKTETEKEALAFQVQCLQSEVSMYRQRIEKLRTQIFVALEEDKQEAKIMEIKFDDSKNVDQKDDTAPINRSSEIMDDVKIEKLSPEPDFELEDDNIPVFREKEHSPLAPIILAYDNQAIEEMPNNPSSDNDEEDYDIVQFNKIQYNIIEDNKLEYRSSEEECSN